jgi:glutathione S-transferase
VAYEIGAPLEYVPVNVIKGDNRAAPYLAKNPNGRVPVLEDGDFFLWESNAIVNYLAAKQGSPLLPTGVRERADADRWMAWQLAHLAPAIRKVAFERVVKKVLKQGEPDQKRIAEGTAEFDEFSRVLDGSLGGKEYVAGRLSVADFALAAHYSIAPTCGLDVTEYPHVNGWLDRVLSRDSMKRALADAQASMR